MSAFPLTLPPHHGIVGIKITEIFYLTHLLFVDDVLIFLNDNIGNTTILQNVFELFQKATCMAINILRSTLTTAGSSWLEVQFALHHFPFTLHSEVLGISFEGPGLQNCVLDLAHL